MAVQQTKKTAGTEQLAAAEDQVRLVLVGRKTQFIMGMGTLYRGKDFGVSPSHAKRLLLAKNRMTGENLFMRAEDYEAMTKTEVSNPLDLGLGEPLAEPKDRPTIEEV
ncbi:hypothetical protein ACRXCV_00410 (plasmid) [Halobacteriovorax sp. GFR7]|uniref:hypothetical protein n=1 Tax=unclassified Halobacteriovorax TaxID=2639665 RepID=UPI003D9755ED